MMLYLFHRKRGRIYERRTRAVKIFIPPSFETVEERKLLELLYIKTKYFII